MFIFHKDTTLEDLGNGVTRRILAHDGKMMAVEVNFAAGAVGPMHNHPHEQLTYRRGDARRQRRRYVV